MEIILDCTAFAVEVTSFSPATDPN